MNVYQLPVTAVVTRGLGGQYGVQPGAPEPLLAAGSYSPGPTSVAETYSDVESGGVRFSGLESASNSSSAFFFSPGDLIDFIGGGTYGFLPNFFDYTILDYPGGIPIYPGSPYLPVLPGTPYADGYISDGGRSP